MRGISRFFLLILFISFLNLGYGQQLKIKEIGTPFINTYLHTDYGAHEQIYTIGQSPEGLMYFAGVTGLLEFDGTQWLVDSRITDDSFYDLSIGNDGRVYGLAKSLIGYLEPDSLGQWKFISLMNKLPSDFKDVGHLWKVDVLEERVMFRGSQSLSIYNPKLDEIEVVETQGRFGGSGVVNEEYYVVDSSNGLMKLEGNQLVFQPNTEDLVNYTVREFLPFSDSQLLIVTEDDGLFIYDASGLMPWQTEVTDFIISNEAFSGEAIGADYFALGTVSGGMVIIDKSGQLVQKLDKSTGLSSDALIQDVFLDKDQNLWLVQEGAISHIVINSPFTLIDERHGVNGYVLFTAEHKGTIYVATSTGTVAKPKKSPWQKTEAYHPFQPINDSKNRTWMFVAQDGDFFALGNDGLQQITDSGIRDIYTGERLWAVVAMKDANQVIAGSIEGNLFLFEKQGSAWVDQGKIKGFNHQMDFLEQTTDGQLWMTDSGSGIFKITLNTSRDSVVSVREYGEKDGLPETQRNRVFRHANGLLFATAKGVYRYDESTDSFQPHKAFNEFVGEQYVFRFIEMANGNIYASLNPSGKALLRKKGDTFEFESAQFERIDSHNSEYVTDLGTNDIWIAGSGLRHYDHDFNFQPSSSFKARIRSVRVSNRNDSLLFGGNGKSLNAELRPKENAIAFTYTSTFFDEIESIEYQSYLEGSEDDWAPWTFETDRNYTNLPHGNYTFKVRGRNIYGDFSEVAEYSFTISTPWYLAWWAYVVYGLLVVLLVWGIIRLNARKLEQENAALERKIKKRTEEIRRQKETAEKDKETIEQQANKLRELDKVKSRFFANISHELRTPLTLINAPLEALMEDERINNGEVKHTLEVAHQNSKRLHSLVEEILDLAKLEAGKLKLVENPVRLEAFIEELLQAYSSMVNEKGIHIELLSKIDPNLAVLCDEKKCAKVMHNLLSNAVKFTPPKGKIEVEIKERDSLLQISVTDNGQGIHPDDLPRIFDRFYQSEQPGKKAEGGTGIGLALAKELAILMGGDLIVESELGEMTRFTFTFRLKKVTEEVLVPLTQVQSNGVQDALENTINRYREHFSIDKPVLLITEDHPEMRAFVSKTLQPYFHIQEAENGEKALSILNNQVVDIIISDVMMPVMDGFELLQQVKSDEKLREVSIVMLTARADMEDKLQALTLGIDDYLTKPFSAAEFLARIKNILDTRIKILRKLRQEEPANEQMNHLNKLANEYGLTERELEILELLSHRYSNAEIADKLFVSTNTIKYHLKNLYQKLGVTNRTEVTSIFEE